MLLRTTQTGTLPTLRRYLSLSQPQLARLLGITRTQLAHAETGARPLAAEPRALLRALLAALPPATRAALTTPAAGAALPPPPPPAPALPPPEAAPLARRRHLATRELDRAQALLAPLLAQATAGQARLALLAAPAAPAALAADAEFEAEARRWTGPAAVARLRLAQARCAALEAELALLAPYLGSR